MKFSAFDEAAMRRALEIAERGLYSTHPNPRVGAVLARDDEIVGEGWHERAGEPHAEPIAIRAAGERARGATAYVTLEPCSHHGRTPPCVDVLLAAGVRRVVYAVGDPNPRVNGAGAKRLKEAGAQGGSRPDGGGGRSAQCRVPHAHAPAPAVRAPEDRARASMAASRSRTARASGSRAKRRARTCSTGARRAARCSRARPR